MGEERIAEGCVVGPSSRLPASLFMHVRACCRHIPLLVSKSQKQARVNLKRTEVAPAGNEGIGLPDDASLKHAGGPGLQQQCVCVCTVVDPD